MHSWRAKLMPGAVIFYAPAPGDLSQLPSLQNNREFIKATDIIRITNETSQLTQPDDWFVMRPGELSPQGISNKT